MLWLWWRGVAEVASPLPPPKVALHPHRAKQEVEEVAGVVVVQGGPTVALQTGQSSRGSYPAASSGNFPSFLPSCCSAADSSWSVCCPSFVVPRRSNREGEETTQLFTRKHLCKHPCYEFFSQHTQNSSCWFLGFLPSNTLI